ncbi:MAG: Ig-like domain-containing protein [Polyangiaceae bacterium]
MRHSPLLLGCVLLLWALPGRADSCARPDLEAAFPGDGAASVPLNATLSAVYAENADYLGEPVTLTSNGQAREVSVRFDSSERRLSVEAAELAPNTTYTLAWPALRGITTAGHGRGLSLTFTTSAALDSEPPEFSGLRELDWDLVHPRDDCTDDLEPRLRFRLGVAAADDDGGRESLQALVFQTAGPAIRAEAPRFVAGPTWPASSTLELDLPVADANGHVCFAVMARDLVGNVSATGSETRCVKTTAPPIFYGCASSRSSHSNHAPSGLALLCATIPFLRRRWRAP